MKSEWNRVEDAVHVFVAKPLSLALYAAWLVTKHLALATTRLAAWLRRSQPTVGRQR
jgi:hypothetical protein